MKILQIVTTFINRAQDVVTGTRRLQEPLTYLHVDWPTRGIELGADDSKTILEARERCFEAVKNLGIKSMVDVHDVPQAAANGMIAAYVVFKEEQMQAVIDEEQKKGKLQGVSMKNKLLYAEVRAICQALKHPDKAIENFNAGRGA